MTSRVVSGHLSPEEQLRDRLRYAIESNGANPAALFELLAYTVETGAWRVVDHGFTSFREFVEAPFPPGIGMPADRLRALLEKFRHPHEDPPKRDPELADRLAAMRREVTRLLDEPLARPGGKRVPGQGDNITLQRGTSASYVRRRLARDRPDLYERVRAGDISANAAAIEAGFRTPTMSVPQEVSALADTLRRKLSAAERRALAERLLAEE